ncbi:MAG: cytochrome P450 [Anaerolineae bacterium]|nr:cytochrome P450 [Anaerolineae bacterium]
MTNTTHLLTTWATPSFFQNPFSFFDQLRRMGKITYLDPLSAWVVLGFHECLAVAPSDTFTPNLSLSEEAAVQLRQVALHQMDQAQATGRFDFLTHVAVPLVQMVTTRLEEVNDVPLVQVITPHALVNGLVTLLQYPKQMALLRANPNLIPQAVVEMLRYDPPVMLWEVQPIAETRIENIPILTGETVYLCSTSANRDPRVYPNADVFDIMRRQPTPHLAFIGARQIEPLVRQILEIVLRVTVECMGRLRQKGEIVYQSTPYYRQTTGLWLETGA